jgi:hypothetical protein
VPLGLRIKPSLREELDRLAEADRGTLASYVEIVLEAHVDAKRQEGKKPKARPLIEIENAYGIGAQSGWRAPRRGDPAGAGDLFRSLKDRATGVYGYGECRRVRAPISGLRGSP